MKKLLFSMIVVAAGLCWQAGDPAIADNALPRTESAVASADSGKANFKGVSFSYNPQVFAEVKTEEIAEQPLESADDKPDGVRPRHIYFELRTLKGNRTARISVFPLADYRRMYAVSKNAVKMHDDGLRDLRAMIGNKNFRRQDQVPYLPFMDAHQTVRAKVKHFPFRGGKGFFFLTQYDQDAAGLVNNDELVYIYQGISGDGKKYVLAEFQVNVPFLTTREIVYEKGFEGYRAPDNLDGTNAKRHKQYQAGITRRLENLPASKFDPNLKYFDEIISSLKIER